MRKRKNSKPLLAPLKAKCMHIATKHNFVRLMQISVSRFSKILTKCCKLRRRMRKLCELYTAEQQNTRFLVSRGHTTFFVFLWDGGKRVWTSSQAALVVTLPHGTGSVNKRNVMHTHLVAASTCCYKRITCMYG